MKKELKGIKVFLHIQPSKYGSSTHRHFDLDLPYGESRFLEGDWGIWLKKRENSSTSFYCLLPHKENLINTFLKKRGYTKKDVNYND